MDDRRCGTCRLWGDAEYGLSNEFRECLWPKQNLPASTIPIGGWRIMAANDGAACPTWNAAP